VHMGLLRLHFGRIMTASCILGCLALGRLALLDSRGGSLPASALEPDLHTRHQLARGPADAELHGNLPPKVVPGSPASVMCGGGLWCTLGLFVLNLFGLFFAFIALAIICDDYLVPPIEFFCERYQIPDEAAGASFLAFGSSAPELVIATIATLGDETPEDGSETGE
jgi:hypothetical protein